MSELLVKAQGLRDVRFVRFFSGRIGADRAAVPANADSCVKDDPSRGLRDATREPCDWLAGIARILGFGCSAQVFPSVIRPVAVMVVYIFGRFLAPNEFIDHAMHTKGSAVYLNPDVGATARMDDTTGRFPSLAAIRDVATFLGGEVMSWPNAPHQKPRVGVVGKALSQECGFWHRYGFNHRRGSFALVARGSGACDGASAASILALSYGEVQ